MPNTKTKHTNMPFRPLILLFIVILFGTQYCSATSVKLDSSNLPIIILKTKVKTQDIDTAYSSYVQCYMWVIDNGPGKFNHVKDSAKFRGYCSIKLHGASSLSFDKKSYAMQAEDSTWTVADRTFIGLPKEHDWDFIANYMDRSLMRNALSQHVFQSMGNYSPRFKHVEIMYNGDYRGVYTVIEKAKRGATRINIQKLNPTDVSGDALTGGYIIKTDWNSTVGWDSKYPKPIDGSYQLFGYDDPGAPVAAQQKYIKAYFDSFESILYNKKATNPPDTNWRRFGDMKSIGDYFLTQEMSKNLDDYRASFFMWKDRNSRDRRIHCGPVWDFDITWYNAGFYEANLFSGYEYCAGDASSGSTQASFWWFKLMGNKPPGLKKSKLSSLNYGPGDSLWMSELKCNWTIYRRSFASDSSMDRWIDSNAVLLLDGPITKTHTGAVKRNFTRWPVFGTSFWNAQVFLAKNFKQECDTMKGFIHRRFAWLDKYLPGTCRRDIDPPTVKLRWKDTVLLEVNTHYIDSGIIYHDNYGDSNVKIIQGNSLDSSTLGYYYYSYFLSDKAGNRTNIDRVIHVVDTIAPIISFGVGDTALVEVNTPYKENNLVISDNYDPSPLLSTYGNFNFKNNIPDSLGYYYLWYKEEDQSFNKDSVLRVIKVVDTIAPLLTLKGKDTVTLEVFATYSDSSVNIKDNYDTIPQLSIHSNLKNYTTDSIGIFSIWYIGKDHSGNSDSIRRIINVIDSIAPRITRLGKDSVSVFQDSVYVDPGYIVTDNYDKKPIILIGGSYINTSMIGVFTVTYQAEDQSKNKSNIIGRVITVNKDTSSGIYPALNPDANISIYPNPGNGLFNVQVHLKYANRAMLTLLDATGREISQFHFDVYNGWNSMIHLEDYPSGIYTLKLQTDRSFSNAKLILIK